MRLLLFVGVLLCLPASGWANEKRSPEITQIVLERTSCFGVCPVYRLTIQRSRKVVWEGKAHVWEVGRETGKISKEGFRQLVAKIEEINFFSLRDRYDGKNADGSGSTVTDLPTRKTSVTRGNQTKTVENYYGGPKGLKQLEDLIDELTNSNQWIRG
jgi:hypothetical protein